MKPRIKCWGYWNYGNPSIEPEFDCDHANSGGFGCEDCIINGGYMSPVSGKPFRGNRRLYARVGDGDEVASKEQV